MKLNKKIVCVFTFIFLVFTYCIPVFAAPVNDLKSSLINLGVPQDQVGNVIEYIEKTNISGDKFQAIQNDIDVTTASLKGTKDLTSLDDATATKVEQNITNGFKELGLTAAFTTSDQTGDVTLVVKETNGTVLLTMDSLATNNILTNFDASKITETLNLSKEANKAGTFQPTTGTEMRQTGTNYGNFIMIGIFMILISAIWISVDRKLEKC